MYTSFVYALSKLLFVVWCRVANLCNGCCNISSTWTFFQTPWLFATCRNPKPQKHGMHIFPHTSQPCPKLSFFSRIEGPLGFVTCPSCFLTMVLKIVNTKPYDLSLPLNISCWVTSISYIPVSKAFVQLYLMDDALKRLDPNNLWNHFYGKMEALINVSLYLLLGTRVACHGTPPLSH